MLAFSRRGAPFRVDAALRLLMAIDDDEVEKARTKTGRRAAVRIVASAADMVMSRRIICGATLLRWMFAFFSENWHQMCE